MPDKRDTPKPQQQPTKKPDDRGKTPDKAEQIDEQLDEQGEITQRNPRVGHDDERR